MGPNLTYLEPLPPQCPPNDALDVAWDAVYRLIDSSQPGADAFKSYAALGDPMPLNFTDHCRWASCSLVLDPGKQKKYAKFKNTHHWAARLKIPQGSGKSKSKNNHIDFWCYADFDMHAAVEAVESV